MKLKSAVFAVAITLASSLALTPRGHAQGGPSDAQIVGIVLAADDIDINYGKLALATSKDKGVRDFAQQMITDHSAVQKSVQELAAKLGVTAQDSDTSNALKTQSQEITAKLKTLKGAAFDKSYIDNEVAYHKAVTDAVAGSLIPNSKNGELKSALEGAQPLFLGHLEHARNVQSSVDKMGSM